MKLLPTPIADLFVIEPDVFGDERGWFAEKLNASIFAASGFHDPIVQVNHSSSAAGVLRGLHLQRGDQAQSKIVYCVRGRLFDVAVDARPGSPTLGQWFGVELSAENKRGLLVPRGFLHGFLSLTDCEMMYFCGKANWNKASEAGVRWNDPTIAIAWPLADGQQPQVNDRDANFPAWAEFLANQVA
jgi:dTDP-4-dehydrorhamnose 3,5-epimerase